MARSHTLLGFRTLESMAHRDFRLLWLSATFNSTGDYFKSVVVGWLIYDVTGSPLLTAFTLGLETFPNLVVNPIGGVLADRMDRRKLMAASAAYHALFTLGLATLLLLGRASAWHVTVYVLVVGMGVAIGQPARTSYASYVVPPRSLLNAYALMSLAYNIAKLTGPGIAGLMLAAYGASRTMLVPVGLMLASIAIIAGLRPIRPEDSGETRSMLREIREAAAAMKRHPVVVALFLNQVVVYAVMVPAVYGMLPIYAADVLEVGPAGLGVLNSSLGAGAIGGVLIMASLGSAVHRGWATLVIMSMGAAAMVAFSQTGSMPAAIAMLVLFNGSLVAMTAIKSSGIQDLTPENLRGRVAALTTMSNGTSWIGGLVFGALAQWQDASLATLVGAGVVLASVAVLYVGYPQLRTYR